MYKKTVFIFRRDLRLKDNIGLQQAIKASEKILPIFIFDERQITNDNEYISYPAMQFMFESLKDLEQQCKDKDGKLYFLYGIAEKELEKVIKEQNIEAVFFNKDYTPFSKKRDSAIESICKKNKIDYYSFHDALINSPDKVFNGSGDPYKVFTAFWKKCLGYGVDEPTNLRNYKLYKPSLKQAVKLTEIEKKYLDNSVENDIAGGSDQVEKILKKIETFKNYDEERDIPELEATTRLSAYLKFGCVSPRQVLHAIKDKLGKNGAALARQVYWRDFHTYIAHHFPHVFGNAFIEKFNDIQWSQSRKNFESWKEGKTGFPIVDAGMRQLNETGYMHNRVRLVVASFLIKDLHISWQWGEKYFASKLIDYDPAVNNGNWQWVASTGCDAAPYFRIFNPWSQQKRFDKECVYIKKWVPELKKVTAKDIHNYFKDSVEIEGYIDPIVDHSVQVKITKKMFEKA